MPQDSSAVRPTNGLYLYLYRDNGVIPKCYSVFTDVALSASNIAVPCLF